LNNEVQIYKQTNEELIKKYEQTQVQIQHISKDKDDVFMALEQLKSENDTRIEVNNQYEKDF
jgi:lipid II:glycine glycyltransferase (peptidoglycan interpeptide bridge formation enzyme)